MRQRARFAGVQEYAIGLLVEVMAVCMLMLVALAVGWLLVSWY